MNMKKASMILSASLKCGAGLSALLFAGLAHAQSDPDNADAEAKSEIVVTGTLVRGVAPAGTNVVGVSKEAVQETGATTTSQLLQTIPQFGSFNNLQAPISGFNTVTTNRPNLRNLPGYTTTGGSGTLMLIDGHRVVGMGISSTTPDIDVIPPGAIERVEIVPDGGSAIYGSDAVAGVINFITRKDINGIEADARYGFADDYHTFDANFTAGHKWDTGSVYVSYNYSEHSQILGRDRDFVKTYPTLLANGTAAGVALAYTAIECPKGNVQNVAGGGIYALPYAKGAGVRGTSNQCDLTDYAALYPQEHRHSVYAGLSQELTDSIKVDLRAFFMSREQYQSLGLFHTSAFIGPAAFGLTPFPQQSNYFVGTPSPFFPFEFHQVSFAWGPDNASYQRVKLNTWGVSNNVTANLGGGWQLRALASYGESDTLSHTHTYAPTDITTAIAAGLFNPYDPNSSNPAALAAIGNYETYGHTKQRQFDGRIVLDGELFHLPGGGVKLAAGAEFTHEGFDTQRGNTVPGYQNTGFPGLSVNGAPVIAPIARIPVYNLSRDVKSAFGELVVPVFGADNATSGIEELTLSVSGRYDDYSDFGDTFNPKFGLTWKPTEWLKFRGAWGKSFAAPSLADTSQADPTALTYFNGGTFTFLVPAAVVTANGYPAPTAGQAGIILLGSKPGTQPQKATTWSVGMDIDPPVVPGLKLGVTYWNIDYKDLIQLAPFTNTTQYFSTFGNTFHINTPTNPITQAEINAVVAGAATIAGTPCAPSPACVYIIEDARKTNQGKFKLSGLDMYANYIHETGFGSIDFAINANYELTRKQAPTPTAAYLDLLAANNSRFKMRTSLGAQVGGLRAQVTWNFTQGYDLNPVVPAAGIYPVQNHVGSFNVFDLFFKYDVPGEGAFSNLAFTLNVNNVFDQDPPVYRAQQIVLSANGYANGNTVGRLIQFGVSKKF